MTARRQRGHIIHSRLAALVSADPAARRRVRALRRALAGATRCTFLVQLRDQALILRSRDLAHGDDRRARRGESERAPQRERGRDRVGIGIVLHEEGASRGAGERTAQRPYSLARGWVRADERGESAVDDVIALSSSRHFTGRWRRSRSTDQGPLRTTYRAS